MEQKPSIKSKSIMAVAFMVLPLMFGIAISQYPYYAYERIDGTIAVYKVDQFGNKYPLLEFLNLQHLINSMGVWA